jgi:hypothetical protein
MEAKKHALSMAITPKRWYDGSPGRAIIFVDNIECRDPDILALLLAQELLSLDRIPLNRKKITWRVLE